VLEPPKKEQFDEQEPTQFSVPRVFPPSLLNWALLWISLIALVLSVGVWLYTCDIFEVPSDVLEGRKQFSKAYREFCERPSYWREEWLHLDRSIRKCIEESRDHDITSLLHRFSPQVIVAYTVNELGLTKSRLKSLAIVPKVSGSSLLFVLSKQEPDVWLLPVVLSLEIEVNISSNGVHFVLLRLRRGSRELTPSLAWAYFGADIELLKKTPYSSVRAV
jgi:hypothetical protein